MVSSPSWKGLAANGLGMEHGHRSGTKCQDNRQGNLRRPLGDPSIGAVG